MRQNPALREFLLEFCDGFCKFNGNDDLWGNAKVGANNVSFIFVGPRTFLTKLSAQLKDCRLVNALYFQKAADVDDVLDVTKRISLDEALQMFPEQDEAKYQPQAPFQFAQAFDALATDMCEQSERMDRVDESMDRLQELCRWNNSILHAIAAHLRIPPAQLTPPKRDEIN